MSESSGRKAYYSHLHQFRGFAILSIVAAHAWGVGAMVSGGWDGDPTPSGKVVSAISEALFHNSTIYFAVISGLLFSMVLRDRGWGAFYRSKVLNVFTPYVVFTTLYAFLLLQLLVAPGQAPLSTTEVLAKLPELILTGQAFGHLWYIPVLLFLFLITPLLDRLVRGKGMWPVICLLLAVPLFVSRSWPDFAWQNFAFFAAPYLMGVVMGKDYEPFMAHFEKARYRTLAVAAISTGLLIWMYYINMPDFYGIDLRESLGYVQKTAIVMLVINLMRLREDQPSKVLALVGTHAFPIYFIHMFFVMLSVFILMEAGLLATAGVSMHLLMGAGILILAICISLAISAGIRKLMGRWSRPLIGA